MENAVENLIKVNGRASEENFWDDVYVDFGEDEDGQGYAVFEGWDDLNKYVAFAKETLEMDADASDWDVEKALELEFVFSDEYTFCDDCRTVIRTSPNSYGWQPDFYIGDGFIVCNKCFNDNEDYQKGYLEDKINNPKSAVNGLLTEEQMIELGFIKLDNTYQSGWYGREDDPQYIYDNISDKFDEVVFFIDSVGQFNVDFVVFVRGEHDYYEED